MEYNDQGRKVQGGVDKAQRGQEEEEGSSVSGRDRDGVPGAWGELGRSGLWRRPGTGQPLGGFHPVVFRRGRGRGCQTLQMRILLLAGRNCFPPYTGLKCISHNSHKIICDEKGKRKPLPHNDRFPMHPLSGDNKANNARWGKPTITPRYSQMIKNLYIDLNVVLRFSSYSIIFPSVDRQPTTPNLQKPPPTIPHKQRTMSEASKTSNA